MNAAQANTSWQTDASNDVVMHVRGRVGLISLNRPNALNALSLSMIRTLTAGLLAWANDDTVLAVAIRGLSRAKPAADGTPPAQGVVPFGHFCAGGDIRFFHTAALAGNPELEDFFTEEYTLNHLIHTYAKPVIAFMDGIVMGGGMGVAQGASVRVATDHTRMAMPETNIGLFPDVGGGYFLSRCPGAWGEYLGLTGDVIGGEQAVAVGLADVCVPASSLPALWDSLGSQAWQSREDVKAWIAINVGAKCITPAGAESHIDQVFSLPSVGDMVQALTRMSEGADAAQSAWAAKTLATLRKRSPLMLHVVLEQIRRARSMNLADALRMERDMVRNCFHRPDGAASETVEGVRALAVDKDHSPKWNPSRLEDVDAAVVAGFFSSPWPAFAHPLRTLQS